MKSLTLVCSQDSGSTFAVKMGDLKGVEREAGSKELSVLSLTHW